MDAAKVVTLKSLCSKVGIDSVMGDKPSPWSDDRNDRNKLSRFGYHVPPPNHYRVTLKYQGRRYTLDFWQGVGITRDPESYGVLECLLSDATAEHESFEEWCSNLGFDTDSRRAERTYRACVKIAARLRRFLGEDFDTFMAAER